MKKLYAIVCIFLSVALLCACNTDKNYVLDEQTFFLVMTNIQYYPEQYENSEIQYDCFTYELTDTDGNSYICGVRKCSSGYGCTCGKDTIIGFLLEYDGELPAPTNQSADDNDKTWVHLTGKLKNAQKQSIVIYSYFDDGSVNTEVTETIVFLVFTVYSFYLIEDYSNLHYYVTK